MTIRCISQLGKRHYFLRDIAKALDLTPTSHIYDRWVVLVGSEHFMKTQFRADNDKIVPVRLVSEEGYVKLMKLYPKLKSHEVEN